MTRWLLVVTIVCGCGGDKHGEGAPGPLFTPGVSGALTVRTPDCKYERRGDTEVRDCVGRQGTLKLTIDVAGDEKRLRSLDMMMLSLDATEARMQVKPVLPPSVVSPALASAIDARLGAKGPVADETIEGVRVHSSVEGQKYRFSLTW